MNKKKLLTTLGAVALIGAIGIGSTFAYLTSSTGTVTNTFTVGNVDFDDDDATNSGIRESEVERDETTGAYKDADGADKWTKTENTYSDLVAGEVVYKDPTIFMAADSVNAWLFVRVYNGTNAAFEAINIDTTTWVKVGEGTEGKNAYVDYGYATPVEGGEHYTVFTEVTMGDITAETVMPQIMVKASAVQAAGLTQTEAYAESVWQ